MGEKIQGPRKKVMVAIDESEHSYYALMWVLNNLKELITTAPLVIFAALPTPTFNYPHAVPLGFSRLYCPVSTNMMTGPEMSTSVQVQYKILLGILEKAKTICSSRGVNAETITEIGDPKEVICKAVQEHSINLLVMGNHTDGVLKRVFSGSMSNYCLNHANCAVLTVKKPE
ncbi:Usp domain-containing protein [Cephalotus follicularis]|uniref:Usp domain-containing protein n=1 Tax=Cephalotus follicularis TaxID=3775 RepID=A0A1Q3BE55_CEPFO|nr:Usp domain-containing protein [Cephalotus follicularis]